MVFDEAHTDLPAYQALIKGLVEKVAREKRPNKFGMVQMSATFGDMPTSKKLTGTITDYYVTDFDKFCKTQPDFFKKKVIKCNLTFKLMLKSYKRMLNVT